MKIKELIYIIVYFILFIILEIVHDNSSIRLLEIFNLSIIPILISSYHLGVRKTLGVCLFVVIFEYIFGSMYTGSIIELLVRYVMGISVYAFASYFPNYKYFYSGILISNLGSYILCIISDTLVYQGHIIESMMYNMIYYVPTLLLTIICIPILIKLLLPYFYNK